MDTQRILNGKRIGIFGKGGAGKSTFTVFLAEALQKRGYQLCVVDADSTNVGLAGALGLSRTPASLLKRFGGTVFTGGPVSCPVDDPVPMTDGDIELETLPDEYLVRGEQSIAFLTAGKVTEDGPGAGCDGPVAKIARDVVVLEQGRSVLTIVDFKAGFEDWARGVITTLDQAIVIVDPTVSGIETAVHMKDVVEQIRRGVPPATQHLDDPDMVEQALDMYRQAHIQGVLCVLNKVFDDDCEEYLRMQLESRGIEPIGVLRLDPQINTAWMRGMRLDSTPWGPTFKSIIGKLEAAENIRATSRPRARSIS